MTTPLAWAILTTPLLPTIPLPSATPSRPTTAVEAQTDALVDAITGTGRDQLVELPAAEIYARLSAQIQRMGMVPAEAKLRRISSWISDDPQWA